MAHVVRQSFADVRWYVKSPPRAVSAFGRLVLPLAREFGLHPATLHRWRERGVLGADGNRRRLLMTRLGGRWYVRDEDLSAFFAALAATEGEPRTPASTTHSAEQAARELDRIGI
jgi:hypothetical protein